MKEIELKNLRKRREKHFLQANGIIRATLYDDDIHFKKNGQYEEIDNTLINENDYYTNKENEYHAFFSNNFNNNDFMKMISGDNYLDIKLINSNIVLPKVKEKNIIYENVIDGIDIEYLLLPTKVKENIIIRNKESMDNDLTFSIKTNLNLVMKKNHIIAFKDNNIVFTIEAPYMNDSNDNHCHDIYYELEKNNDNYILKMIINKIWLENAVYPVVIDPTITNQGQDNSVYDTYIYPGDTDVDRNNQDILKVGVEEVNGKEIVNRTLIKFDLPTIGTGSQVIDATLNLVGYGLNIKDYFDHSSETELINVHQITEEWNEDSANWNNMNDKFNLRIEATFNSYRSRLLQYSAYEFELIPEICSANITNLVKKWYTNTPNYGIMLKANKEQKRSDFVPAFYSKNNKFEGSSPKPILSISYRNQNGLESYMDYETQSFSLGNTYLNTYNGNLVGVFDLSKTFGGNFPANLSLIYNTNDVILKNSILNNNIGLGFMLNYYQTIRPVLIDSTNYLEYLDEDKTLHYFYRDSTIDENGETIFDGTKYIDEDGMGLTIEVTSNNYTLVDKDNNKMIFEIKNDIGYLSAITDNNNSKVTIEYNNDNLVSKIKDTYGSEITINYELTSITISGPSDTITLNITNDKIDNIATKSGKIYFSYNKDNLIDTIVDINNKKIKYEYYNQMPYRIKRIIEYGLNNREGASFNVLYGFNATTIVDNKGRVITKSYNNSGTITSISNLKEKDSLSEAYGMYEEYGEDFTSEFDGINPSKNKLLSRRIPVKYINNYLTNSSCEEEDTSFNKYGWVNYYYSDTFVHTGLKSLECYANEANSMMEKFIKVPKGKYYTFSVYVKSFNRCRISLSYEGEKRNVDIRESEVEIGIDPEWKRVSLTLYYDEYATSDLILRFIFDDQGQCYFDDMQLEEGQVANNFNMLENSNFTDGLEGWNAEAYDIDEEKELKVKDIFEIVQVADDTKALKIRMNPTVSSSISRTFNVHGNQGDTYNISFWYKNEGLYASGLIGDTVSNNVSIFFNYVNDDFGMGTIQLPAFNTNDTDWQYYSQSVPALSDFNSFKLDFYQANNANYMYIANICLVKDVREVNYEYDENGNIISSSGLDNEIISYNYDDNNQLVKETDSEGKVVNYEYDNVVKNRQISTITENGISSKAKYDSFGNPLYNITKSVNVSNIADGYYRIRLKGTNKFLKIKNNKVIVSDDSNTPDLWKIEKSGEYYTICHSIINNKYFNMANDILTLSSNSNDYNLLNLEKNCNGSYIISSKISEDIDVSNSEKDKNLNTKRCLSYDAQDNLNISEYVDNNYHFEFYFELPSTDFFETSTQYTDDGRYSVSSIDTLLNKTFYDTDAENGLSKKVVDPKGNIVYYEYNNMDQMIKVTNNNRTINYDYNENGLISRIYNKYVDYKIYYDDFLNISRITVNDYVNLINKEYEPNNGQLQSLIYGNDHRLNYSYDEFDRLDTLTTMDNKYNYKYDNNGNLAKIISDDFIVKFVFDLSKRINEYIYNDCKIKYKYDKRGNITSRNYSISDNSILLNYEFNLNNDLIQMKILDDTINYVHDDLCRIVKKTINHKFIINYNYIDNGHRLSNHIKSIDNNGDKYSYKYDKLNNIKNIYHNDKLELCYIYDEYNQLIEERNIKDNKLIKYIYDNNGNIIIKQILNGSDYSLITQNTYSYSNLWKDQLIKFNDCTIEYDEIGNPILIGTNQLTWINGRQLCSYNNIFYKYNDDGYRIKKMVDGNVTNFYYEGSSLILEESSNKVITYLYNKNEEIIGFRYNNNLYYYLKNLQGDIVGIIYNNEIIAKYIYDSFGNILNIVSHDGTSITDSTHVAYINPIRYRGYYYDSETNLYYLNSRYYNPLWGRFINADNYISTNTGILGYNMYSYCNNNFVNNSDENGHLFGIALVVGLIIYSAVNTKKVKSKAKSEIADVQAKNENKTAMPDPKFDKTLKSNAETVKKETSGKNIVERSLYIKNNSGSYKKYDLKRTPEWKGKTIYYDGLWMEDQDLGNYHFGYISRAAGLPKAEIIMGAGAYQLYEHGFDTINNCLSAGFCDDYRDTFFILRGIKAYDRDHK